MLQTDHAIGNAIITCMLIMMRSIPVQAFFRRKLGVVFESDLKEADHVNIDGDCLSVDGTSFGLLFACNKTFNLKNKANRRKKVPQPCLLMLINCKLCASS